ncbi:Bud site selection protein RAX2 [Lachnellula cervina]|uniref:Bud site selection protein RAX2 n=1 Tax=Lachnellula cervina TaxID=1316786 RepID=A0A7D8UU58_9HELO|nr:Bud site selection protein RAX2 [Lachnellula cervina]
MKLSSWLSPAGDPPRLIQLGFLLASLARSSHGITFNPIPSANLDLDDLGRTALVGDFDGISLYQFEGQNENGFLANGSQSLQTQFPNGGFATLASADAGIQAMCPFVLKNGTLAGIVVGGNFTSLGKEPSAGAAMFDPTTSTVIPLTGLSGQVSALLCDQDTNTVYVGGSFRGANSTNAIAWVGGSGWENLPFAGFNGPVTSITKAANGHIVFGGAFTGLGNSSAPTKQDQQIVNISGANITSGPSTSTAGFSDPRNIVCKTDGTDGSGNTWLLADDTPGFWKADFGFGFQPTSLRLYNTHQEGRGTKTWRYTAMPLNGIMNFTYIDPATGQNASCSSECPLSNNSSMQFQDFHFVNEVGMNTFQIDISAWYGDGGGLNGIELFENDIFAYAINDFNEPVCAGSQIPSNTTVTGPWTVTPSHQSVSEYLTLAVNDTTSASVVFLPSIKQSGNYSVNIYTPGCMQDNSCSTRGHVNVTGAMASGSSTAGFTTDISQTNNFDKYDQIYFGYVESATSSFQPSITLSPSVGQAIPNLSVVAQRVGFTLISSTGGLNSLFEYDPTKAVINTADFANSTFDKAGISLGSGSGVNALETSESTTYVAGNFSTDTYKNIFAISDSGAEALPGGSLNGEVVTLLLNGTTLYAGGKFTDTSAGGTSGLSHVAAYDTSKNTWAALGAGVNGVVENIVPISMNVTTGVPETVITLTGVFNQTIASGKSKSIAVTGFAVWVPSRADWLQNLNVSTSAINGELTAAVDIPGGGTLFAGSLSSSQLNANDIVSLSTSSSLSTLPVQIQPASAQSSGLTKRATSTTSQNVTGIVTGLFHENGDLNVTILGGHFTATGTNGSDINNIVFINGSNSDAVTGVGSQISNDSTILALAVQGDNLYAGGSLTGTVNGGQLNGLASFNLVTSTFNIQPPALAGGNVAVNAISVRPGKSGDVYVGGDFSQAGSLSCPGVCLFATAAAQWDRPGDNLDGIANAMVWSSTNSLIVGGALSINGVNASLVTYDAKAQTWAVAAGAETIPGPVTALAAANSDASQLWVSGTATNGSTFLMKFDGSTWNSVGNTLGSGTSIRGLQVLPLNKKHTSSSLVPGNQDVMITGSLNLPGFGNASAVVYDGSTFQPFALTSTASNTGGSLSQIFISKQNVFAAPHHKIARGFVVLIALAVALGLIFLIVIAGVIAERVRRKREGYMPAPTNSYDRSNAMSRIRPDELLSNLGQGRGGIEKQSARI